MIRLATRVAVLAMLVVALGCTVNPATGKRQLTLVTESQELAMGRQYDQQMVAQLGLYDDEALERFVQQLGRRLAALSERPDLEWQFRVVDDPTVNAFALPGGYVYITRGILAHLNSEAELAAIIGHEIGHVTARHSVNQMSKQQVAGLVLGAGAVLAPEVMRDYGDLAMVAGGLAFLKFSRDDERQADELGLRYLNRAGYDPRPMVEVFDMLKRVSAAAGGQRLPGWQSTHPAPENREAWAREAIASLDVAGRPVKRDEYLSTIDGMVFGEDPRQGYFEGARFLHPELRFRLDFPDGWKTRNTHSAVQAIAPASDGAVALTLASKESVQAALDEFLGQQGMSRTDGGVGTIHGLPTAGAGFRAETSQGNLTGVVAFVEHEGRVLRLLGYAPEARWPDHGAALRDAVRSFTRLSDRSALDVQPRRVQVVRIEDALSLGTLRSRYDATVDADTLALINDVDPGVRLVAGRHYKVVTGGRRGGS